MIHTIYSLPYLPFTLPCFDVTTTSDMHTHQATVRRKLMLATNFTESLELLIHAEYMYKQTTAHLCTHTQACTHTHTRTHMYARQPDKITSGAFYDNRSERTAGGPYNNTRKVNTQYAQQHMYM